MTLSPFYQVVRAASDVNLGNLVLYFQVFLRAEFRFSFPSVPMPVKEVVP